MEETILHQNGKRRNLDKNARAIGTNGNLLETVATEVKNTPKQ
jgi:hypothetical protein